MTIETELMAIKGSKDLLVPEEVVEWAEQHPNSELYRQFEWDDDEAAKQYRIWQARRIIALNIVNVGGQRTMLSLTIDRSRPGGGYREVNDILADQTLYDVMIADAVAELKRVQAKYDYITQLKPVWAAVARVAASQKRRKAKGRRKGGGEARIGA